MNYKITISFKGKTLTVTSANYAALGKILSSGRQNVFLTLRPSL